MFQEVKDTANNYELTKILNRVQELSVKKVYAYNKMEAINSKPALQRGNENLLEYNVTLPLHISFCDPEEVIDIIKTRAEKGEPFDWVFHGKYMGQFVIDSVERKFQNMVKGVVIYAEVTFNLLEFPSESEFQEQILGEADLSGVEQFSENSNKVKVFALKAKETVIQNIKESVATSLISDNLSDAAKELVASSAEAVLKDISGGNITSIFTRSVELAQNIRQSGTLNFSDLTETYEIVNNIPKQMISAVLRKNPGDTT